MKYRLYDFIDGTIKIESNDIFDIVRYVNNYDGSMCKLVIQIKKNNHYETMY